MKTIKVWVILMLLIPLQQGLQAQKLSKKIVKSVTELESSLPTIQQDRKVVLDQLASRIYKQKRTSETGSVIFLDNKNKLKSQLAAIWLKTGLLHHQLDGYGIESAGLEVEEEPFPQLAALKKYGFKVSNAGGKKLYSYSVDFGSDSWNVSYKDRNSLENSEEALKVFVEEGMAMEDDPMEISVPFYSPDAIASEMLYVASRIDYLTQSQQQ